MKLDLSEEKTAYTIDDIHDLLDGEQIELIEGRVN